MSSASSQASSNGASMKESAGTGSSQQGFPQFSDLPLELQLYLLENMPAVVRD
jgi:hypothetical protein